MKKFLIQLGLLSLIAGLFLSCGDTEASSQKTDADAAKAAEEKVVVYAYDSFTADWGPAGALSALFKEQTGIAVEFISAGDAGQVLNRAILEKGSGKADIVLGIDNNLLSKAREADIFTVYEPQKKGEIPEELFFDSENRIMPFDHGYFSIIYDSERIDDPPSSLEELTAPRFRDSLILMDPRTSSPGLGFLLWTVAVYGDGYLDYWERLSPSILTITEGWDSGYGLFTSGEAPLVLSYTTSPPYHVEFEESHRFKAALFSDGHYRQIEGLGILKTAPHPEAARRFVDFILTEEAQAVIPLTNFMMPVNQKTALPDSFDYAPVPDKGLLLSTNEIRERSEEWIQSWLSVAGR